MADEKLWNETFADRKVTYHLEIDGTFILVRNVPARVNVETGEELFAPETVEHLLALVKSARQPDCTVETPVYEYA